MINLYADDKIIMSFPDSDDVKELPTNCPNCGAPVTDSRCEYCGTIFGWYRGIDWAKEESELERLRRESMAEELQFSQQNQTAELISIAMESMEPYIIQNIRQELEENDVLASRILIPIMTKESWIKRFFKKEIKI